MKYAPDPYDSTKDIVMLKLYVSGMSHKSMIAIENVKRLCNKYLENKFELEIIDIYKNPSLASEHQIVFSPSLVKYFPLPKKVFIGTFSDTDKMLRGLGIVVKE